MKLLNENLATAGSGVLKIGRVNEKRFYNRETNSATFCLIQQMSIKIPFPLM
jgi:hypothetical protein